MLTERKQAFVDVTEATYTARLRALAYKARTIVEETGANNLYLAFGMLRWTFNDRELRSPLVLVPVTLESVGRGQRLQPDARRGGRVDTQLLPAREAAHQPGLEIPGPRQSGEGRLRHRPARGLRRRRARRSLEAHLPFTVEDTVDLSILQFAKFRLWKDLDENWEELAANSLVSHLIATPTEPFVTPSPTPRRRVDLDELEHAVPVPADSSQLEAVAEAVADRTFVLEGPPGTGKSQTITNLLAQLADRRQARALRRREARGARRGQAATGCRRPGPVLARPARQGREARRRARADQGGARRSRTSRSAQR